MGFDTGIVWFRRDLRVDDNAPLASALKVCKKVYCVFIFDTAILKNLPRQDRRVEFIRESLVSLDEDLRSLSGFPAAGIITRHGNSGQEIPELARELGAQVVFAARDYEPSAQSRDELVGSTLTKYGIQFQLVKDQVVFEEKEILTKTGTPYSVFTAYKNAWLSRFPEVSALSHDSRTTLTHLAERPGPMRKNVPELVDIGFEQTNLKELKVPTGSPGAHALFDDFWDRMDQYGQARDFPAIKGPSYLGMHLRFGTISIRRLARVAWERTTHGSAGAAVWLSELIWRDFYFQILANFPHVATGAFKPEYDSISWETGPRADGLYDAWCTGQTGFPLVDAAMAQLNQTGYMHNRLRMVAGSFLVKDLGIDWRTGEQYFAEKLNDFDLSANNGGWQWVSSSGCDAQPYFRIFNPVAQSEKFDPDGKFIRKYLPQLAQLPAREIHSPWNAEKEVLTACGVQLGHNYPAPIVDHKIARESTLRRYSVVRKIRSD